MTVFLSYLKGLVLGLPILVTLGILSGFFYPFDVAANIPVDGNKLAVVELYTSQSCSSCPPADRFLGELSDHENLITLGCHVTYWDHLHWKDTMSRDFCTQRQRASASYRNSNRVFTPELQINGQQSFIGSRKGSVIAALSKSANIDRIKSAGQLSETLQIQLGARPKGLHTIWLVGVQKEHHQVIPRGENRGKTVVYRNSVVSFDRAGVWGGSARSLDIKLPESASGDIDYWVVLAQKNSYGDIVAAGKFDR
jgi:hypothetical protein